MRFVVVTGMSGAGKSSVLKMLEDAGYFCVDNFPILLLKKFAELGQPPIILTSHVIRLYFYRLIEQFYPNVRVLSFNEIANNIQIQSIGSLVLDNTSRR